MSDSTWVACGPSHEVVVPLVDSSPLEREPPTVAIVGRKNDLQWAVQVSRQHGQLVATPDGHIWYRDSSTFGTFVLDGSERQLPAGVWCDVTGFDLCLGAAVESRARVLHLLNRAASPRGQRPTKLRIPNAEIRAAAQGAGSDAQTQSPMADNLQLTVWDPVPDRVTDIADSVSSGFRVGIGHRTVTLPLNGRPVPFGRDPQLVDHGGLVLFSVDVSRVHGFIRFNVFGGSRRGAEEIAGAVEIYDGNGQGRASTNHIMILRAGQSGLATPLVSGRFQAVNAVDLITLADVILVVATDPVYPRGSMVLGDSADYQQ